jgi:hypothetical protein
VQDIDRTSWDVDHASGYLLCFDVPFGQDEPGCHADHYDGIAKVLERRLSRHAQGKGAKLTGHVRRAGIGWTLTRVWENIDRTEERRLKENSGMAWCPRCRTEKVMAARDPAYGAAIEAAKAQYKATISDAKTARAAAASRSAGTRLWNKAVTQAHELLQQTRHDAAAAWISEHPRSGLRAAALECVLNGTPVVSPPSRPRQAVLDAQAATDAQAVPDGFVAAGADALEPTSLTEPTDPWNPAGPQEPEQERQLVSVSADPEQPDFEAG